MKDGWASVTLGDLSTFARGLTYAKSDQVDVPGIPVLRAGNIDLNRHALDLSDLRYVRDSVNVAPTQRVARDSILVCMSSGSKDHLGKVAYVDTDLCYAFGGFMGLVTTGPRLDPRYLYYLMTSARYRDFIDRLADGTNINNLRFNDLARFEIPLPSPAEQRRIVAILDDAFAHIASALAATDWARVEASAVFETALGDVFADAYERTESVPLAHLATDITDGDHMPPPKSSEGVPFITIGNIDARTGKIDFSDTFRVPAGYFDRLKPNRRPRQGDVLYTVTGSFGIPVQVGEFGDFCFQRHIALVRPSPQTDSTWLYYLLLSPQVRHQAATGATGTAQKTVSLGRLRSLNVPVIPLDRQCADAARLDALRTEVQSLEDVYRRKLAALDELKASLLHEAFSGNL